MIWLNRFACFRDRQRESRYDHGQMLIHLDNFLSDRKISEIRKLIKLIRQSYTPECEEQIKEYIQCRVKELDNIIMITEKRIDRNEAEVKDAEKDLKTWLYFRSLHKKGSDGYKHYMMVMEEKAVGFIRVRKTVNFTILTEKHHDNHSRKHFRV